MTTVQQLLNYAVQQIGTKENPMGSNHTKYTDWYGEGSVFWCAIFVSYCFYNAGLPLPATKSKGFAFCPYGVTWFKAQGWWHTTPQVGDVVFYDQNSDGTSDHVGIVEKVNADGSVVAIEGNESNQVKRMTRKHEIMGYGRPPYTPSDSPNNGNSTVVPPAWPRYIFLTSPYMQGNDILRWQQQMIHRGWELEADSVFKEKDHDILIKFQEQKGLKPDGVIGPISWDKAWTAPITRD